MAYGNQFLKITWGFTIDGTDEIADTSLNFTSAPSWTGAAAALAELDTGDLTNLAASYVDDLLDPDGMVWADYSVLASVKAAAIGTNGLYLADPLVAEISGPTQGTATDVLPQSTVVVTLRAASTIGKGNLGRIYPPHTKLPQDAGDPVGNSDARVAAAAAAKDFVNSCQTILNGALTATVFPVIMSQATGTPTKIVDSVSVGSVVDTQRRRRNRLQENYTTVSLT